MPEVNELLREHVTSTGFHLHLGKTHIAQLVELDIDLRRNMTYKEYVDAGLYVVPHNVFRTFSVSMGGLVRRGLVEHILPAKYRQPGVSTQGLRKRRIWRITPAGRLVVKLLQEVGIYQEYAALLPTPKTAGDDRDGAVAS